MCRIDLVFYTILLFFFGYYTTKQPISSPFLLFFFFWNSNIFQIVILESLLLFHLLWNGGIMMSIQKIYRNHFHWIWVSFLCRDGKNNPSYLTHFVPHGFFLPILVSCLTVMSPFSFLLITESHNQGWKNIFSPCSPRRTLLSAPFSSWPTYPTLDPFDPCRFLWDGTPMIWHV